MSLNLSNLVVEFLKQNQEKKFTSKEIADWVLRPDSSKRELGDLAKLYLNEILPEPDPNQLVPDDSALDVAGRAWFIRRIDEAIRSVMDAATLALFLEIELPTLTTLAAMELRGITVNKAKLENLSRELGERAEKAKQEAFAVIGREVNLASPKQLQEILFDQMQLPVLKKTPTGAPSTAEEVLAELALEYEFPKLITEHRGLSKLKSTYTDKLPKMQNPHTGRVLASSQLPQMMQLARELCGGQIGLTPDAASFAILAQLEHQQLAAATGTAQLKQLAEQGSTTAAYLYLSVLMQQPELNEAVSQQAQQQQD